MLVISFAVDEGVELDELEVLDDAAGGVSGFNAAPDTSSTSVTTPNTVLRNNALLSIFFLRLALNPLQYYIP